MGSLRADRLGALLVGILALVVLAVGGGYVGTRATARVAAPAPVASVTPPTPIPTPTPTAVAPAPARPVAEPVVEVRPLTTLVVPDLLVTGTRTITAVQLAALRKIIGVTSLVPVSVGTIRLAGGPVTALGADPSTVRPVTPAPTAASDPLWRSVARGELMTTFATATAQHLRLGSAVPIGGRAVRLGSFADLRLPGIGALAGPQLARALRLVPQAGVILTAPSRDVRGLDADVRQILDQPAVAILRPFVPALSGRATLSKPLYEQAAVTCPGLPWTVLAAIGGIESDHGADTAVSPAGAEGPMQFLPATFAEYGVDADHDGQASIDDPADAVYSAARMLCHDGAGRGGAPLRGAIFAYNHAEWYVDAVLQLAAQYAA